MAKTKQNIPAEDDIIVAGDDFTLTDTITEDGSAKNLTGATVTFVLSHYPGSAPIISKDSGGADVDIADAGGDIVTIDIRGTETADLGAADGLEYSYVIKVDDGSNKRSVTTGEIEIHAHKE